MSEKILSFKDFIEKSDGEMMVSIDYETNFVSLSVSDSDGLKFFFLLSLSDFLEKFPGIAHADPLYTQFGFKLNALNKKSIYEDLSENGLPHLLSVNM